MKTNYLTFLLLFSVCFGFAQTKDSLSVEEQERREKNIQAGNPFKKFGYKPKIATLSKGKYLEFHDLDSIVKIGSFTYHVKNKVITGIIQIEKRNSEATLSPEIISRWMSPDPLSDEFPSWSPYNFVYNNPIRFVDPLGLAPEDLILKGDENAINKFVEISNAGLGGNYVNVDGDGNVSLNATEEQISNMSDEQKGFYNVLNESVSAEGNVTMNLVVNDVDIIIGGSDSGKVDVGDIDNIVNGSALTKQSVLGHEVKEQYEIQLGGSKDKYEAHNKGENAEKTITGYTRTGTTTNHRQQIIPKSAKSNVTGSGLGNPYKKALSGTTTVTFTRDNKTQTATIYYQYGNVTTTKEK